MKPTSAETAVIVLEFKCGKPIKQIADEWGWSVRKVERAIRRWLNTYPEGKL